MKTANKVAHLLLVEDDDVDAERICRWVTKISEPHWTVTRARSLAETQSILDDLNPTLALVDLTLPDARGMDTVEALTSRYPDCPIVVQSGVDDTDVPNQALTLGAQDYLIKDTLDFEKLSRSIDYARARKSAQIELLEAHTALAKTDSELDDFAHVVAHDLRGPVRTARLLANRLLDATTKGLDTVEDLGGRLDVALERVDTMILSMLDYTELRNDEPDLAPLSLAGAAREAADSLEADTLSVGGRVEVDIDPDIVVSASPDLMQRVFVNLLGNALKYVRPDVAPFVRFTAELDDKWTYVRVSDNGLGIPEDDMERVFEVLERLDPRASSGLGFGLAICKRIMDRHGGDIWAEQNELGGVTFALKLPR